MDQRLPGVREAVHLRASRQQLGGDALWVAGTCGEAEPTAVEDAMYWHLQSTVHVSVAPVYDAATRTEQPAVLLRAPTDRAALATATVAAGLAIR
eukprot:10744515-Lingulodinium_polyedra.AAC.1